MVYTDGRKQGKPRKTGRLKEDCGRPSVKSLKAFH